MECFYPHVEDCSRKFSYTVAHYTMWDLGVETYIVEMPSIPLTSTKFDQK